jgi:hypothetical protein
MKVTLNKERTAMSFIELTGYETGRTVLVRTESIDLFLSYINDDEGKRYTKVWVRGETMGVFESPEEIRRRIEAAVKAAWTCMPLTMGETQ